MSSGRDQWREICECRIAISRVDFESALLCHLRVGLSLSAIMKMFGSENDSENNCLWKW